MTAWTENIHARVVQLTGKRNSSDVANVRPDLVSVAILSRRLSLLSWANAVVKARRLSRTIGLPHPVLCRQDTRAQRLDKLAQIIDEINRTFLDFKDHP
jgi:hypothetical protein